MWVCSLLFITLKRRWSPTSVTQPPTSGKRMWVTSTLHIPHSTLHTPHSTLHTQHSTLHTPGKGMWACGSREDCPGHMGHPHALLVFGFRHRVFPSCPLPHPTQAATSLLSSSCLAASVTHVPNMPGKKTAKGKKEEKGKRLVLRSCITQF